MGSQLLLDARFHEIRLFKGIMLKKIFFLLKRTTGYWLKFVISLLVLVAALFWERQFLTGERTAFFHGKESIGILCLFPLAIIGIVLLTVVWSLIKYYDKQFGDLIFWLAWPKFFTAVFYCFAILPGLLISCAAYRVIHMILFGWGAGTASVLLFVVSLLFVWIYLFRPEHFCLVHKRRRQQSVSASVNPWINSVKTMVCNRFRNVSYVLLLFLTLSGSLFVSGIIPYEYRMYLCFAAIILLMGIEDFYWKNEENNFSVYRINSVCIKKYLIVQYAASAFFNFWAILLFFFTFADPLRITLLFLLLCFVIFYWQQVYVYLGMANYNSLGIRNLFCILFMGLMLIPIGNIVVSLFLLSKNSKGWNGNDLD